MFSPILRRSAVSLRIPAARAIRSFSSFKPSYSPSSKNEIEVTANTLSEVKGPDSLFGPGGEQGKVPSDLDISTGVDRLELLGKLEGVDVWDLRPLDSSRIGTMMDPIIVDSYDDFRYVGCTGSPAGSHDVSWMRVETEKVGRCWECGSVYKLNPIGRPDPHHH